VNHPIVDRLDLLRDAAVRSALELELGRRIEHHTRIASTQDRARSLADEGAAAAVVVADEQTAGRGRHGRAWHAPARHALLASWLFRPLPSDPALFALLASVAAARALAELGVDGARLKWPNDVQLSGRKVAGILADAVTDSAGGALVLGIGINVHQAAADLVDLASATSLAIEGAAVDRLALLARLCGQLDRLAASPDERRAALEEWRVRSATLGREVEVRPASGSPLRGLARALADDGSLVLETTTGVERIVAGDVSIL
jgi:BirA family transcriptional regulator, biotin operon repressor / biotin---[acetyl-CoA-carboxylase] ligase